MRRLATILLCAGSLCLIAHATLWAQATAQISGAVKDQSGAVLPGVEIAATQTETGITRATVTNETGSYVLPNLPLGPYRIEASLPGFRTYVQTGIVLQVNSSPEINVQLQVGQVTEQVEVQANAALVETRNVGVGQVIENERILELPLNGRQVTDLIALSGAAVQTVQSATDKNRSMPGAVAMSVAGGFSSGTVYVLDGAMHNDPWNNLNLPLPFPDALQEFKVETSALSAQYGMYSGASVTSVTKSGTNDFHGDVFEFVRNDLFNARNYFATKGSTLKRNQFGGTLGGALVKNKLFFFGGYQGTTLRQDPADQKSFVPTAAMLAGDFTAVSSPACNSGRQIPLKAPFTDSRVDPALFSKAALAIANKLPKTSDPCGAVTFGVKSISNEGQYVGRFDYQRNDKNSLFGRLLINKFKQPVPYSIDPNLLNTTFNGFDDLSQAYAFGNTYLISPNTVNSFRLAVNRSSVVRSGPEFLSAPDVGVNAYAYKEKQIHLTIAGGPTLGVIFGPNNTTTYQANDDVNLIRGAHQVAVGINIAHWRNNLNSDAFAPGNYTFNAQETGMGLADFLTGKMSQLMQAAPNTTYMSQWYFGLYGADGWKATSRLTVNYGVRWEPFFPQVLRNGIITTFDEQKYAAKVHTRVFNNAPFGFSYPGDPGFPGTSCRPSGICSAKGMNNQWKNVAPRLGLAWDPQGNGRTSVRASYSLGYDLLTAGFYTTFISPPWSSSIIVASPPGGFDNPWLGYPGGNPFPPPKIDANALFVPNGNYFVVQENAKSTTRHSWNLSVQKQLAADWLVSASYLGNQAVHVWGSHELNPGIFMPGSCTLNGVFYNPCSTTGNRDQRRRLGLTYPNVGGTSIAFLDQYEPQGTQSYHGLLLNVQRRAARGVSIGANYTWSHCITDFATSQSSGGGTPGRTYLDPNNRSFDRGNCDGDRRQILNLTSVVQSPQFANNLLRDVLSGWRLSGIYRRSTGAFLTVTSGVDRMLNGVQNQRAELVLTNPYGAKTLTNYLNPSAFAAPALGSLGNMSPLNIQGPAQWTFDLALSRTFNVRESQRIEVRAEAYNVTNSLRPGNPVTALNSAIFGQINTSADPRIMQFALKYVF
jgi:hypothetical protein